MALSHLAFLRLWRDAAPGALTDAADVALPDMHVPTLQVFLPAPERASGASVVVCPGGGYQMLADYEGPDVALWLAQQGVTAFVLRYRLGPTYTYPRQLEDGQRAIRFVRAQALDWGLDPDRIGMLGFSAGGHLTSMVATRFTPGVAEASDPIERVSSRPTLQVLVYPVISFHETYTPVAAVLGGDPHPAVALLDELSSEKHVRADTPPAFLVHSTEDKPVPIKNADLYAAALKAREIPYVYIRGELGGHGFGMRDFWTQPCIDWLGSMDFVR